MIFSFSLLLGEPRAAANEDDAWLEDLEKEFSELKAEADQLKRKIGTSKEQAAKGSDLVGRSFSLIQEERYKDAKDALDELGKVDPENFHIPLYRDLIAQLERETDPERKRQLISKVAVRQLTEGLERWKQNLEELDSLSAEVMPQNLEEELVFASIEGDLVKAKELIEEGASANAKNRQEWTALNQAARWGHLEIVKLLLAHGADVNMRDSIGGTPLINAASRGHVNIVSVLLEAQADVVAKDLIGVTALMMAEKKGHAEVVELLRRDRTQDK